MSGVPSVELNLSQRQRRKRRMDNKWKSLEARGYTRPKSRVENDQRARDAHHKITPQLGRVR